mgnify:CR=1 FL=1
MIKQAEKSEPVLLPEIEVRVSESWINFIQWCKINVPHGQVCFKINNGEPGDLVNDYTKVRINFSKKGMQSSLPSFI